MPSDDTLVAPYIERLVPYKPGKPIAEVERELGIPSAVKLASNENPLGPSPRVAEAISGALGELHRYPDGPAHALRDGLAEHLGVSADEIIVGSGSSELIDLVLRTFAVPGSHAVLGDPSFAYYRLGLLSCGIESTEVPFRDHLYTDVDALRRAVRKETKLLLLANPNNPTGTHVDGGALTRLLRDTPEHVVVMVDEAYMEYANDPSFQEALGLRALRERLVVLRTFSKAYGIAGLRVGFAVAPPHLIDYLNRVRPPFNVGTLAQVGALAALRDPAHLLRVVELNARERERAYRHFSRLGLAAAPSQANFVLVHVRRSGQELFDRMLRLGVIVRPMPPPLSEWLRITIGLPEENDRLFAALEEALRQPA